ncbi:MAG: hypothetical protein ACRC41_14565 [Sarcina sp.]
MDSKNNLKGEYLEMYNTVIDEIEAEELTINYTAEIKNDVLDILLSAQQDGVKPINIIGNTREFIDELVHDFKKSTLGVYTFGKSIAHLLSVMGIIALMRIENGQLAITVDLLFIGILAPVTSLLGIKYSKSLNLGISRRSKSILIDLGSYVVLTIIVTFIAVFLKIPTIFTISSAYPLVIGSIILGFAILCLIEFKYK